MSLDLRKQLTYIQCDFVPRRHKVLEGGLVLHLQVLAVLQREVLFGQLVRDLALPAAGSLAAQPGHRLIGQLLEVADDPRRGSQSGWNPRKAQIPRLHSGIRRGNQLETESLVDVGRLLLVYGMCLARTFAGLAGFPGKSEGFEIVEYLNLNIINCSTSGNSGNILKSH